MKKHDKWSDLEKRTMTPKQIEESRRWAEREIIEMNLAELRALAGVTQVEAAAAAEMAQGQVSAIERRSDHLLSTLRRYVEALGGELEVRAVIGDKTVRLRGV